jgi:hypothetical protein
LEHVVKISCVVKSENPVELFCEILAWLKTHAGAIDADWDCQDRETFLFKDSGTATLFALVWS